MRACSRGAVSALVRMPLALGEEALGVERRHAAGARRGDRLAVDVVLRRRRPRRRPGRSSRSTPLREQVAGLVVVEPVEEQLRRRVVADRDEEPVRRQSCVSPVSTLRSRTPVSLPSSTPSTSSTTYGVRNSIFSWARARSTMIGDARKSSRRWTIVTLVANFVRKIASSIAESPPPTTTTSRSRKNAAVAGRAVRDAAALQRPLGLEPELARGRARGDDHGLGAVLLVADVDPERALGEVDARHVVGEVLGAEALGLRAEVAASSRGPRTPSA